ESAFTVERLAAVNVGDTMTVGPWEAKLERVDPVAGPNWTALEAVVSARYEGGKAIELDPQARDFWAPSQKTNESALYTRWNGQLYVVVGEETEGGQWQLRLWWKPFVTWIWYGGVLIALGGLLALIGRVAGDIRRRSLKVRIARRHRMADDPEPAA